VTATASPPRAPSAPAAPATNRRRRGVLGGAVLIAVGLTYLLAAVGVADATSYLFVLLGVAFAYAYAQGMRPYAYLVPAAILVGFGLGLLVPRWISLPADAAAPVFLASLTVGLVAIYLIQPQARWPLVPAAVFGLIALAGVFRLATIIPEGLQPYFVPTILIVVGVYLIFGARR